MLRSRRSTIATAVITGLLLLGVVSCGGDDNDGLKDYLRKVEQSNADAADAGTAINEGLGPKIATSSTEQLGALLQDVLGRYGELVTNYDTGLRALDPPDDVQDAHQQNLDAITNVKDALASADAGLAQVRSQADVIPLLTPVFASLEELKAGCEAFQALADEADLTADFRCSEVSGPALS